MASRLFFVLSIFSFLSVSFGDTIAFLDSGNSPYLKASAPSSLTHSAFDAIVTTLSNTPITVTVDTSVSDEVDQFLLPNVFNRPSLVWTLALVGATKGDFGEERKYTDLTGKHMGSSRPSFLAFSEQCKGHCLTDGFQALTNQIGGSFKEGSVGLNGQLTYSKCPSMESGLSLDGESLFFWAVELSGLWNELHGTTQMHLNGVVKLETTLTGLYFIRQQFGNDSKELKAALCFTRAAVTSLHQSLSHQVNGKVFTSILLHDSNSDVPQVTNWRDALERRSRSLLSSIEGSDQDPTTTTEEKTRSFSANSVGYVMFLIISFSALCSIYALSNMDFTKDTLLYSQAKID